jgi:drebrin-like protein
MEDNEMPLLEGEIIEDVEQIDEGWWAGTGPGGKSGLFPGGYFSVTVSRGYFTDLS